jgi:DNA-binding transcriptional regulator GbsR (MarR family)
MGAMPGRTGRSPESRPGTRPESQRDPTEVERYVERLAGTLVEMGTNRMGARVFAALVASEEGRVPAAELGRRLQASPAAISGAVRYLEQAGMLHREREPGSRRDLYALHTNLWLETIVDRGRLMDRWGDRMREGVDVLGPQTPGGKRLRETAAFFEFISKELPVMLERWRDHRATLDLD